MPFGVAASQIDDLSGKTADTELGLGRPFRFRGLDDQASFDTEINVQQLPTGNWVVSLF